MGSSRNMLGRAGLFATAAIFLAAVSLSNTALQGLRIDLTENGLYTLSVGTRKILGDLD